MQELQSKKTKIIDIDNELVEILMQVKKRISKLTYSAMDKISWREASRVLARIIIEEKIII